MTVAAVVATLPTIYILLRPSFYKIRKEEHAAAASEGEMQQKKRQDSTWTSWATSEVVHDGDAAAQRSTNGGGLPRIPSMTHFRSGSRLPPTPNPSGIHGEDSWGRGPWSGGHQWFDTQISSGGCGSGTVSTSASATRSRRSMDHGNHDCASGVITVETVVEQETVDIAEMSEMTEITSFMTLPPMAKFHGSPV